MATTLAFAEQPLALVQAANEDPDVKSLTAAYAAMELLETQLWIQKHVRPDETFLVLDTKGPSAFGKGAENGFTWGFGPIVVKASVDTVRLTIKASVSINLPIVGTKELVTVDGNLKDGVKGEIDALFAKGSVTFFLKNGLELWVKLEVSGPLCPKIDKEFKIFKLCESNDQ
ncbi:hypothetical protein OPQ81_002403 [Rhizoctonia solani]|nr:hypothetical protein OPQ81_002403 [Rhizoctonia solani]